MASASPLLQEGQADRSRQTQKCFGVRRSYVSIDQVAHVRLVRFEVDGLSTCLPDDFTQFEILRSTSFLIPPIRRRL